MSRNLRSTKWTVQFNISFIRKHPIALTKPISQTPSSRPLTWIISLDHLSHGFKPPHRSFPIPSLHRHHTSPHHRHHSTVTSPLTRPPDRPPLRPPRTINNWPGLASVAGLSWNQFLASTPCQAWPGWPVSGQSGATSGLGRGVRPGYHTVTLSHCHTTHMLGSFCLFSKQKGNFERPKFRQKNAKKLWI